VFLDAFVDPRGRPTFLGTVCQLSGMLKVAGGAGAEAGAGAGAAEAGAIEAGAVGAGATVGVGGAGYGCAVRSWKWVGRLLYAIRASSFFFFLSGQSGDQDGCFPAQGMHLCFVRSSLPKQSRVACPIAEQIPHREMFLHIFATCPYEKQLKHWVTKHSPEKGSQSWSWQFQIRPLSIRVFACSGSATLMWRGPVVRPERRSFFFYVSQRISTFPQSFGFCLYISSFACSWS
jgi:hypothetical protein